MVSAYFYYFNISAVFFNLELIIKFLISFGTIRTSFTLDNDLACRLSIARTESFIWKLQFF